MALRYRVKATMTKHGFNLFGCAGIWDSSYCCSTNAHAVWAVWAFCSGSPLLGEGHARVSGEAQASYVEQWKLHARFSAMGLECEGLARKIFGRDTTRPVIMLRTSTVVFSTPIWPSLIFLGVLACWPGVPALMGLMPAGLVGLCLFGIFREARRLSKMVSGDPTEFGRKGQKEAPPD